MTGMNLSILCVTKAEDFSAPFLFHLIELGSRLKAEVVFGADGREAYGRLMGLKGAYIMPVESRGFIESVLDDAITACTRQYILRMDDDERCSPKMIEWLEARSFEASDHWKFPRAHVWKRDDACIVNPPLWPDHQTRLSLRAKSGGRQTIHAGSPFGGGTIAPVLIEHHKFMVKTPEQRRAIRDRYDAVTPGYGSGGMLPFNMPEDVWDEDHVDMRFITEMELEIAIAGASV